MSRAVRAGLAYFAAMFALGFLLGSARVLWLAPRLGEAAAVALELPIMLAASWFACRWTVRRWSVPARVTERLMMGGMALALLLAAEVALGLLAFGRSLAEQGAAMTHGGGLAGLIGQLAFAAFPLVQLAAGRRR